MSLRITPIPCLQDNYAYLLVCEKTGRAAVVDPSEPDPVLRALQAEGLRLDAILNTHHHWDHTGGNEALLDSFPGIPVYGHHSDEGRIPGQTVRLETGDILSIGEARATVYHIPGHTLGAVAYFFRGAAPDQSAADRDGANRDSADRDGADRDGAVFTGDTLFGGGCGRLFEGTPEMMNRSLNEVLAALPGSTRVYFGHEYTQKNLEFALTLEPHNQALRDRKARVDAARAAGRITVPSTISEELATNPFMRCDSPELRRSLEARHLAGNGTPSEVLGAVRLLKDNY